MTWLRFIIEKKRLERQRKFEQMVCPHEYKEVYAYYKDGDEYYDVYCPLCEKKVEDIVSWKWKQTQKLQKVRNEYHVKFEED